MKEREIKSLQVSIKDLESEVCKLKDEVMQEQYLSHLN